VNLWVPPRWARRLIWQPLIWALGVWLLIGAIPAIVLLIAVLSFALPGKLRPLRLFGFALVYLTIQIVGMTLALLTWVASGFGWAIRRPAFVTAHYAILRGCLACLFWFGRRYFQLTVDAEGPDLPGDDGDPSTHEHPLLVMSRHGGPGDSFLLVHEILTWAGRRPRIVLKHTLQLDPVIDLLLNRLPMRFLDPAAAQQGESLQAIAQLASTMEPRDAIVIFPEGGNVTPRRRMRAIERLRASGRAEAAARAERIVHLMPPRPGGVHAALCANPDLHVVVVAHTGLDQMDSLADVWRELPDSKTLHMRWHAVPGDLVPHDLAGVATWLFDEWEQMDRWVAAHRVADAGPEPDPGVAPAPPDATQPEGPTAAPDAAPTRAQSWAESEDPPGEVHVGR
jgi:1-acyl-sn-glycerol-3-phosphate acyltransferase